MPKTLFKSAKGEIHFGLNAPPGFASLNKDDAKKILSNLGKMKLWRCAVCNDMHIGIAPPQVCPTCGTLNAYVEISMQELKTVIGL